MLYTIGSKKTLSNPIAIVNWGATALFIDFLFAQLHKLKFISMQHFYNFTIIDGKIVFSGAITHTIRIVFALRAHRKVIELFVIRLSQYLVVLGLQWLWKHDLYICFKNNTITFDSKRCLDHCISIHQAIMICDIDTTFNILHKTLHEIHKTYKTCCTHKIPRKTSHKICCTQKTLYKSRYSTTRLWYSFYSNHWINMADCIKKINQKLILLKNSIVDAIE